MQLRHLLQLNNLFSDDTPGSIEYQTSGSESTIALMRQLMNSLDK